MPSSRELQTNGFYREIVSGGGWAMLPSTVGVEFFDVLGDGWTIEKKLDGHRLLVGIDRFGEPFAATRNGLDPVIAGRLPWLAEALTEVLPNGSAIDGELIAQPGVAHGRTYVTVSGIMKSEPVLAATRQRMEGPLRFAAFDLLFYAGEDLRSVALEDRRGVLRRLLVMEEPEVSARPLFLLPWLPPEPGVVESWIGQGMEGAIAKRRSGLYENGRSRKNGWHRAKAHGEEDMVVMGFTDAKYGKGGKFFMSDGTPMIGAVRLGQYYQGLLTERCQASGMNDELRRAMTVDPDAYIGRVVAVKHYGFLKGTDGGMRHPQLKGFRDDKGPSECLWTES